MEEVEFFHRVSRTAIIGDLIQRHSEFAMSAWKGRMMPLDGGPRSPQYECTPHAWSFVRNLKYGYRFARFTSL